MTAGASFVPDAGGSGRMARAPASTLLAFLLPAALLAGAWIAQFGGLYPCEMCHWQRWPHYAALVVAATALAVPGARRPLTIVAALLIAASGVIAVLHAGVEYGWWQGFTACTSAVQLTGATAADRLDQIMAAPLVRCDRAAWTLAGVSLAGFNAILSLGGATAILAMVGRGR